METKDSTCVHLRVDRHQVSMRQLHRTFRYLPEAVASGLNHVTGYQAVLEEELLVDVSSSIPRKGKSGMPVKVSVRTPYRHDLLGRESDCAEEIGDRLLALTSLPENSVMVTVALVSSGFAIRRGDDNQEKQLSMSGALWGGNRSRGGG